MTAISFMVNLMSWNMAILWWSIWCEAGTLVAIDGFPGETSCGFPNVQVATLAQLDAQLRASQTDFWGMWGEWWEGDGWEMRAWRA